MRSHEVDPASEILLSAASHPTEALVFAERSLSYLWYHTRFSLIEPVSHVRPMRSHTSDRGLTVALKSCLGSFPAASLKTFMMKSQSSFLYAGHFATRFEQSHGVAAPDTATLPTWQSVGHFFTQSSLAVVAHGVVNHVRWQGQGVLWLDTDPGQAERLLQHLNHFLISEQVELADRTGELALLRLVGPAAATIFGKAFAIAVP